MQGCYPRGRRVCTISPPVFCCRARAFAVVKTEVVTGGSINLQGGAGVPFAGFGVVLWQAGAFFV